MVSRWVLEWLLFILMRLLRLIGLVFCVLDEEVEFRRVKMVSN